MELAIIINLVLLSALTAALVMVSIDEAREEKRKTRRTEWTKAKSDEFGKAA